MQKINFQNLPSTTTPVNASNLNQVQTNVENAMVEQEYLGNNPDINSLKIKSGIYGIYNCSQAPTLDIGTLEVIRYTDDWILQRLTVIDNNIWNTWERIYYNGTTWSDWENKTIGQIRQWTPIMENANVTYERQTGYYLKIGNLVFVTWRLQGTINSVSSPAYAVINGLPYNSISTEQAGSLFEYANCFNDNTTPRLVRITNNQKIGIQNGGLGGITLSSWEAGHGTFYLSGSATYLTDD